MMVVFIVPVIMSFLLLAAHFFRAGDFFLVGICLGAPLLLLARRPVTVRLIQAMLVFGALKWIHTMFTIIAIRSEMGQPWLRFAAIIGGVALFTVLSAGVFRTRGSPGFTDESRAVGHRPAAAQMRWAVQGKMPECLSP
jgi:uncharacterized membrane protein